MKQRGETMYWRTKLTSWYILLLTLRNKVLNVSLLSRCGRCCLE